MLNGKINALTSIRGLAALLVIFSHLEQYNYFYLTKFQGIGSISVAIFFSLSGFLMGYLYLSKDFTKESAYSYVISRFSRIAPPYLAVVVLSYFVFNYIDSSFSIAIDNANLFRHLLFSGNAGVLWSIPPEVQFYIIFLVFWWSIKKYKQNIVLPLGLLLVLFLISIYYQDNFPGVVVFSKLAFFLFGTLAGCVRFSYKFTDGFLSITRLFQYVFIAWALLVFASPSITSEGVSFWNNVTNALWPAILVFVFSFETERLGRFINCRAFIKMGEWSFSIYLIHSFVLHFGSFWIGNSALEAIFIVVLSIAVSFMFYSWVEQPGVKWTKKMLANPTLKNRIINIFSRFA